MTKGTVIMYRGNSEKESKRIYDALVAYKEKKGTVDVDYLYDNEFKESGNITDVVRHIKDSPYAIEGYTYVVEVNFDIALTAHSIVSSFSIKGGEQK